MCRWIIFISDNPIILEDLLIKPDHSIVDQVHDRFRPGIFQGVSTEDANELKGFVQYLFNVHGFGLTWYTDTVSKFHRSLPGLQPAQLRTIALQPAQFRTIAPISTDLAFQQLCAHTASTCILAHVRDASPPQPITVETNNHPFIFGDTTFMQNGGIDAFDIICFDVLERIYFLQKIAQAHPSVKSKSSVWKANYIFAIKGNTDTEHLGALFIVYLDIIRGATNAARNFIYDFGPSTILMALVLAIKDIHNIQESRQGTRDGRDSLERFQDGQPLSLYISFTAGAKLNREYYPDGPPVPPIEEDLYNEEVKIRTAEEMIEEYQKHPPRSPQGMNVIVGSEPSTRDVKDWGLFGKNQCLTHDKEGNFEIQDMQTLMQDPVQARLRALFDYFLNILDKYEESPPPPGHPLPDLPEMPHGMPVRMPTEDSKLELFDTKKSIKLNLRSPE